MAKGSEYIADCDPAILEKLKKLYDLSESAKKIDSANEANTALLMFRKIIAKNNLNIDENYFRDQKEREQKEKLEVVRDYLIRFKQRRVFWKIQLACVLAEQFRCKVYSTYYQYKSASIDFMYSIMVMGKKEDVETVKYIFKSFIYIAENCVKSYCNKFKDTFDEMYGQRVDTKTRAKIKNDYLEGFIEGIRAALEEQNRTDSEVALVLATPKEVEDEFAMIKFNSTKPKNFKSESIRMRMNNPKIFRDGYEDGYDSITNKDKRITDGN